KARKRAFMGTSDWARGSKGRRSVRAATVDSVEREGAVEHHFVRQDNRLVHGKHHGPEERHSVAPLVEPCAHCERGAALALQDDVVLRVSTPAARGESRDLDPDGAVLAELRE